MINKLKIILVLVIFSSVYSCSGQLKMNDLGVLSIDYQFYNQFSHKFDLDTFNISNLDYNDINSDSFILVDEFDGIKSVFEDEEVYFYSVLQNCRAFVLLSRSNYNGKSIKLYLVSLTKDGHICNKIIIAEKSVYPGSFRKISSFLCESVLTKIKLDSYVSDYIEEEKRYSSIIDSVTFKFDLSDDIYVQIFQDSVRIVR